TARHPSSIAYGCFALWPLRASTQNPSTGTMQRRFRILQIALRWQDCLERLRMDRDPDSGRRVSRLNRKSAWHEGNVPRLEVVSAVPQDDVIHRLGAGGL